MIIVGFETSCDETSVAVVCERTVRANVVASQIDLHTEYGGVVPELATREHLRRILPLGRKALHEGGIEDPREVDVVAATAGPGLPNALMTGLKAAQGFAAAIEKPFFGIHHHEAHLYSPWISGSPSRMDWDNMEPAIVLIVSGGHTMLVYLSSPHRHRVLGGTVDDAAGECFDKTAKMIGLPYPGGPEIDRLARDGDPHRFSFPRPMLRDSHDDFSFSGLKTSVRYFLQKNPRLCDDLQAVSDLCAGIQAAIIEVLVEKSCRAARRTRVGCVAAAGGVTCNRGLRESLSRRCGELGLRCRLAEADYCTDNAAMVALLAEGKMLHGESPSPPDLDPRPSWTL